MKINILKKLFFAEILAEICRCQHIVTADASWLKPHIDFFKLSFGSRKLCFDSVSLLLFARGCDKISLSAPAFLLFDNTLDAFNLF